MLLAAALGQSTGDVCHRDAPSPSTALACFHPSWVGAAHGLLLGKVGEGQDLGARIGQVRRRGREALGQLLDHPPVLGDHLGGVGLGEDRAHQGRHQGLGGLGHLGEQVPEVMGAAALPGGPGEHRAGGVHQPGVGVGDHQLHAAKAAGMKAAQEGGPAGAVF